MGKLAGCDYQSVSELHDVKISSLGITQHFTNEIDRVLDLAVGTSIGITQHFTEISIINIHPPLFTIFRYKYWISEPIWVVHFFDKVGV
jgi:hypothetical protein